MQKKDFRRVFCLTSTD